MLIQSSRRDFITGLTAAGLLPAIPAFAAGTKTRVALQMYSIGKYVREVQTGGFAVVFRELADMGYKGVEFAGFSDYGSKIRTVEEMKKMLDDAGMVAAGPFL